MQDDDPYVRKTAAVCVAKLFDINPELVEDRGFLDMLRVRSTKSCLRAACQVQMDVAAFSTSLSCTRCSRSSKHAVAAAHACSARSS